MLLSQLGRKRPLAVVAVALGLAGALAACGDSDDDAGTDQAQQPDATATAPERGDEPTSDPGSQAGDASGDPGEGDADRPAGSRDRPSGDGGSTDGGGDSEEGRVAATVTGMYRDFAEGDAAGVCAVMARAAREQMAQQVLGGSTVAPANRTCADSLSKFLDAAAAAGTLERTLGATVENVRIRGGIATVTVRIAGRTGKIQLLREGSDWRFGVGALPGGQR